MSTKCVHLTAILPWNLPFSVPALNKQYPDLNWTTQKWTWWISLPSKISRIMNLNPQKSIAYISFILSSEYPQGINNASPRDVVTDNDMVVDERYLIMESPYHRIPTQFVSKDVKIQHGECSFSIICHPFVTRPTRNWREAQITEKFAWLPFFTVLSASFAYLQERVKHCLEAVRSDFQAKRMKNIRKYYSKYNRIV